MSNLDPAELMRRLVEEADSYSHDEVCLTRDEARQVAGALEERKRLSGSTRRVVESMVERILAGEPADEVGEDFLDEYGYSPALGDLQRLVDRAAEAEELLRYAEPRIENQTLARRMRAFRACRRPLMPDHPSPDPAELAFEEWWRLNAPYGQSKSHARTIFHAGRADALEERERLRARLQECEKDAARMSGQLQDQEDEVFGLLAEAAKWVPDGVPLRLDIGAVLRDEDPDA